MWTGLHIGTNEIINEKVTRVQPDDDLEEETRKFLDALASLYLFSNKGLRDNVAIQEGRAIRCPVCLMVSYNRNDVREGYCGNCHRWTAPRGL